MKNLLLLCLGDSAYQAEVAVAKIFCPTVCRTLVVEFVVVDVFPFQPVPFPLETVTE